MRHPRFAAAVAAAAGVWIAAATTGPGDVALRAQGRATTAPAKTGPVIVLETVKGTIEIQTFPEDAPKTVASMVALVKKNFYTGLRFHRAEKGLLVQIGDPQSRDMRMIDWWGRSSGGPPIGVAEITSRRKNVRGAVGMANTGDPKAASSQFYILLRAAPSLDGKFTIWGQVVKGLDVAAKIAVADVLKKASVRE